VEFNIFSYKNQLVFAVTKIRDIVKSFFSYIYLMKDFCILTTVGVKFKTRVSGAELSSFKSGGTVPLVFFPETAGQVIRLFKVLKNTPVKYRILGGGTNTLIGDKGFDGIIVCLKDFKNCAVKGKIMETDAGTAMPRLAYAAAQEGLSGFEFASGIPGSVGGGVYMNAGAYGEDIAGVILYADVYDIRKDEIIRFKKEELKLSYRRSRFSGGDGNELILRAAFELKEGDIDSVKEKMRRFKKKRADNQPKEPSLGSTFRRFEEVIPAVLIDKAGLKGYNIGGACVSAKHAGFIVNIGNAKSSDYAAVMNRVKEIVSNKYGVELTPEIELL
jgi:UDP-N-acetylmuramate dehydrogenase